MDLYLMDAILKGHTPDRGSVLDVGCGQGRNGLYFLRGGYNYFGIDPDIPSLKLVEYLSSQYKGASCAFAATTIHEFKPEKRFDLIICSQVLHFAKNKEDFLSMWDQLSRLIHPSGVIYVAMDSLIDTKLNGKWDGEHYQFPDGKCRFPLVADVYELMKKGFEEIEALKTLVLHAQRAQSFMLLRKS